MTNENIITASYWKCNSKRPCWWVARIQTDVNKMCVCSKWLDVCGQTKSAKSGLYGGFVQDTFALTKSVLFKSATFTLPFYFFTGRRNEWRNLFGSPHFFSSGFPKQFRKESWQTINLLMESVRHTDCKSVFELGFFK